MILPEDIFRPTFVSFKTAIGTFHLVGFMNLFGASTTSPYNAVRSMTVATESSVNYILNAAVRN